MGLLFIASFILINESRGILLSFLEDGEPIPPEYGDLLFVLGGGLRPKVTLGFSTEERLELAIQLYRQKARPILVSDGSLYTHSPAIPYFRQYLIRNGVDPNHILFEGKSQNTFQNMVFGLDIIRRKGYKHIIACTSPYHQSRVKMLGRKLHFPDFRVAYMAKSEIRSSSGIRQWVRNLRLIAREYVAILRLKLFQH